MTVRGLRFALLALCLAAAVPAAGPAAASAAPPPPAGLTAEGGEETWRPKRAFRLVWSNPVGGPTIAAVHYRLRDPTGAVAIGATRIDWAATSLDRLEVPASPGAYTAEVWLEDADGRLGPPATAVLRFDDVRPGSIDAYVGSAATQVDSVWVGRAAFPLPIRLTPPAGDWPVSGIRGYALSIAPPPGRDPCLAADRCAESEIDLHGGPDDHTYRIADLAEGVHRVQAVAVSGSGMTSPVPVGVLLRVDETDPIATLSGVPAGWTDRPVTLTATATDRGSGMQAASGGVSPYTAISVDGGPPTVSAGASTTATIVAEGVHSVAHYARDLAGNVADGGSTNGVPNPDPPTTLVRIDRTPPLVSFLNGQDPDDPELIRARVGDSRSGPSETKGWIGVRRSGSGEPFAPLPRQPAPRGELRARWDSGACATGDYEFRAVAYDAAGNSIASRRRANGTAMVLPSPLKAGSTLGAGFGSDFSPRRSVPHGRAALLTGRLATAAGRSLGSLPVRIVERFVDSGLPPRASVVRADPDGAFAVRLAPGPSREVTAVFAGTPTLGRSASSPLTLGVRAGVRLRTSSRVARIGAAPLVFSGRILAAKGTLPAEGKAVQLQFRLPGLPWSAFRTIHTDRGGRFHYAYRFSDDDSRGARFLFRAFAPAQGDWPYEPAGSRPVAVRGR